MSSRPNMSYRPRLFSQDVSKMDMGRQMPDTRHQAPYTPDTCFVYVTICRRHLDLTVSWCENFECFPPEVWDSCLESNGTTESRVIKYYSGLIWLHCPISYPIDASQYLSMWLDLTKTHQQTWLFSSTSTYHSTDLMTARPTWSSTEQVARSATKRFHLSDWRPLEACCWPWTRQVQQRDGYAMMMIF